MSLIAGIYGDRGSGKTCLLTAFLKMAKDAGHPIVSDFHLTFNGVNYMSLKQISKLPDALDNAVIGLDEIQTALYSRRSGSKKAEQFNKLILQLRKRKCHLFYTTQRFRQVDVNLRDQTDFVIACEKTEESGIFTLTVMDRWGTKTLNELQFNARSTFGLFNTDEIVSFEGEGEEEDYNPKELEDMFT